MGSKKHFNRELTREELETLLAEGLVSIRRSGPGLTVEFEGDELTPVGKANAALQAALEQAEVVGNYGKETKNDTAILIVGSVDMGESSALGVAFAGSLDSVVKNLVRAMQKSPEVRRAVGLASEFYDIFGDKLDACDCDKCKEEKSIIN